MNNFDLLKLSELFLGCKNITVQDINYIFFHLKAPAFSSVFHQLFVYFNALLFLSDLYRDLVQFIKINTFKLIVLTVIVKVSSACHRFFSFCHSTVFLQMSV